MAEIKPPRESLVKYENPIEVSNTSDATRGLQGKKKPQLPPLESKPSTEVCLEWIQDILNAILPPIEWDHDGKHYIQYVSHVPASREDVANLQKLLDERLLARQARYFDSRI